MIALFAAAGRVEPSDLGATAAEVARQQVGLAAAFAVLAGRLDAVAGMAGDDAPGRAFAGVYGPAVDSAFAGYAAAVRILDAVTTTLITTANNHSRADHASTPGPAGTADLLARPPTTPPAVRTPAAVTGPGSPAPSELVRSYWPLADPPALGDAASSWQAAGAALADATAALGTAVAYLEIGNTGPDVDAIVAFWSGLIGPGPTLFAELVRLCAAVAGLCRRYATLVEDTHRAVRRAIGIMLATGLALATTEVGVVVVPDVALAEAEALLDPIAEEFAARLPAEVLTAVDPGLVASVGQLAATGSPRAVEAELTELGDASDALLGGAAVAAAPGAIPTQVVPRFTASSFANPAVTSEHFRDHASDFGSSTAESYSAAATSFLHYAQENHLPAFISDEGIIRVYDPATNILGSYDSTTEQIITFFRPTSRTYWDNNKHNWGSAVIWAS